MMDLAEIDYPDGKDKKMRGNMKKRYITILIFIGILVSYLVYINIEKEKVLPDSLIKLEKNKHVVFAFHPDNEHIVFGQEKSIKIWDMKTKAVSNELENSKHNIFTLLISYNKKYLISGGGVSNSGMKGEINFWNLENKSLEKQIETGTGAIYSLSNSNVKNNIVVGQESGEITVWQLSDKKQIKSFGTLDCEVNSILNIPDTKLIASGDEKGVNLWNVKTGHKLKTLVVEKMKGAIELAYSEKTEILASDNRSIINLWDISSGKKIKTIKFSHDKVITGLAFHPNDDILAASSMDGIITLINIKNDYQKSFQAHENYISSISFSKDGKYFATGGLDGYIKIWHFDKLFQLVMNTEA